jgi:cytochrome c551/c552
MCTLRIAMPLVLLGLYVPCPTPAAVVLDADAKRGEQLFATQACERCHAINGKGGTAAPDLGRTLGRDYTPASLAARMWNHAPAMWSAMARQNLGPKPLAEQDAADLVAYFYSVRFFDTPADAGRGKRLFQEKRCSGCHGSAVSGQQSSAKPVAEWQSPGNPIELASAMWNHSSNMREAFASRNIRWPELTGQDISDLALYARTVPSSRGKAAAFTPSAEGGQALFESKGCAGCHVGKLSLDSRLNRMTLNGVAAAMWSHAGRMGDKVPRLDASEMSKVVTWLWTRQLLAAGGNPARGKNVFTAKGCSGCHTGTGGAPSLSAKKGSFSTVSVVSSLSHHGPRMLDTMKQKNVAWPRFTPAEMSDMIAYVNTGQ